MKIQLEANGSRNVIRAYRAGQVTINDQTYATSLLLTPDRVVTDWPPATFVELTAAHFEVMARLRPEIVILGTGARLRFPHPSVTAPLIKANIGLEVMDTGAACRTYNILLGDRRRVLAALLMIESA